MGKESNKNGKAVTANTTAKDFASKVVIATIPKESDKVQTAAAEPAKQIEEAKTPCSTELKEEVKESTLQVETKPQTTIESQKVRVATLASLLEKLDVLHATKNNLLKYKFAASGSTNRILLEDGQGASFKTHNAEIIAKFHDIVFDVTIRSIDETELAILAL